MGGFRGFVHDLGQTVSTIADAAGAQPSEHEKQRREDAVKLRDQQADELEKTISALSADTTLSAQEKTFRIGEARKQLTGLYQPHEGAHLLKRLSRLGKKGQPGPMSESLGLPGTPGMEVGGATIPGGPSQAVTLKPGMTYEEVLSSVPTQKPTSMLTPEEQRHAALVAAGLEAKATDREDKGTVGLWMKDAKGDMIPAQIKDGKAVPIELPEGMTATEKPSGKPEENLSYDEHTGQVTDKATGKRYSAEDANLPSDVAAMFKGAKKVREEKMAEETRKFDESTTKMLVGFQYALSRGDYTAARREVNKVKASYDDATDRMQTMDANLPEGLKGNQQAMVSLVANHIGMTLGMQRNARITRASWEEAQQSAPWLARVESHFDPNSGYLTGVTLTPEQMKQMVQLAHDKVGVLGEHVKRVEGEYADDLGVKTKTKKGEKKQAETDESAPDPLGILK